MAFNINDIRSKLTFGGARPTLFKVELTNPVNNAGDEVAQFMIQSTTIPASMISTIEVPYFGRKIKVAGDRTFDAWSVDVINDEDFKVRHNLELWHNQINSLQTNLNKNATSAPRTYKSTAIVTQYGKTGVILRKYKFNGIFPMDIAAINLDWGATDQLETFGVTFAYDWWEVEGGNTGSVQ